MAKSGSDQPQQTSAARKAELEAFLHQTFDDPIQNTRLHKAILGDLNPPHDNEPKGTPQQILAKVKELLALDNELIKLGGKSIINQTAFQNTALLLAIKQGLIDVALAILTHTNVDVNAHDKSGLSALQMACMLRSDVLINKLLDKKAKPDGNPSPVAIYQFQPSQNDLRDILNIATYRIIGEGYAYRFAEGPDEPRARISWDKPEIDVYADFFIFYMQPLLRNLGIATGSDLTKLDQAAVQERSEDVFRQSYILGVPLFLEARGQIAPNNLVLTRLGYTPPKQEEHVVNMKASQKASDHKAQYKAQYKEKGTPSKSATSVDMSLFNTKKIAPPASSPDPKKENNTKAYKHKYGGNDSDD